MPNQIINIGSIVMHNPNITVQPKAKPKKPVNLEQYELTKEFAESIESGELYEQLKPRKAGKAKKGK